MFKIFSRRNKKSSVMSDVWQRMNRAAEIKQRKAADYLNTRASVLTMRQLKIGLLIFCLLFGGCSFYIVWRAFNNPISSVSVKSFNIPNHAIISEPKNGQQGILTKEEIASIKSFQQFLDSIQMTTEGKRIYDSIARHRPGLLDSLYLVQQLFNEQLK